MSSFSPMHWAVVALLALLVWAVFGRRSGGAKQLVCLECGTLAPARVKFLGGLAAEIAAWLIALVAAALSGWWPLLVLPLAFSLARQVHRKRVCSACGSSRLVPPETPVAQRLVRDLAPPRDEAPRP